MRKRGIITAIALLMVVAATAQIAAARSQNKREKVFEVVPEHLRARLVERLELYVKYERARAYEKLYDLLWDSIVESSDEYREAYVNASRKAVAEGYRRVLLEFKPTATVNISLDESGDRTSYDIWGQAKVDDEGKVYWKDAAIQARFIDGEWYFSSVADVTID